jgi:hypothetical protein
MSFTLTYLDQHHGPKPDLVSGILTTATQCTSSNDSYHSATSSLTQEEIDSDDITFYGNSGLPTATTTRHTYGIEGRFVDGAGPRFENTQSVTKPGFNTYTVRPLPGGGRKVTCPDDTFMTRLGPNVVEFKVKKRRSARQQSHGSESALLGHPNNHTSPPSR